MYLNKISYIIGGIILVACVNSRAPKGSLPGTTEFVKSGYGSWMTVKYQQKDTIQNAEGEFIAIDSLNLFILTESGTEKLQLHNINEAWLELQGDSKKSMVRAISFLGFLSTLSHGFFLVFSAPVWLLAGTATSVAESKADIYTMENPSAEWWYEMRKYSRFPQGLPANLHDLSLLNPKPVSSDKEVSQK